MTETAWGVTAMLAGAGIYIKFSALSLHFKRPIRFLKPYRSCKQIIIQTK